MTAEIQKTAIVTGASRGIGAAIAERLARDGLAVVINYAGSATAAETLAAAVQQVGGKAVAVQADVSDAAAMRRLFDTAEAVYGGVDVIVNNAGIMELAPIAETSDDLFDRTIAINLKGVFNSMREAAKRLRSGGRIISLSSSVVGLYQPNYAVYAATKGAIEAMTHVVAKELRGRNITVNAIAPGPTGTDLFLKGKSQALIDELANLSPLQRLGTPQDIAAAVSWLAGPGGSWINAQIIRVNGGVI